MRSVTPLARSHYPVPHSSVVGFAQIDGWPDGDQLVLEGCDAR
jgi:hypothetical protein